MKRPATDSGSQAAASRRGGWLPCAVIIFVAIFYVWIVTAGTFRISPQYTPVGKGGYYDLQAEAFCQGSASLLVKPDPRLLALPDPYDPNANAKVCLHDMVLYHGRYYLYWGPLPALLLALFKACTGCGPVGDNVLTLVFTLGTLLWMAALIWAIRRRLWPRSPAWVAALCILIVGLMAPLTFLLARPAVYEAAIMGGQCFLMGALFLLFTALARPGLSKFRLAGAGVLLAAAAATRVSLAPAALALALLAAWHLWHHRPQHARRSWQAVTALILPVFLGLGLLLFYNKLRFDSWTEYGNTYQLARFNMREHAGRFMSVRNIPVNLYNYFISLPSFDTVFPFVRADPGRAPSPPGFEVPGLGPELVTGLLITTPFTLIAFFALGVFRKRREPNAPPVEEASPPTQARPVSLERWLVTALLIAGFVGFLPPLAIGTCTMRFLGDLAPSLGVLAAVGTLRLLDGCGGTPWRCRQTWGIIALALISLFFGLTLSVSGYSDQLKTWNPRLFDALRAASAGPWVQPRIDSESSPNDFMVLYHKRTMLLGYGDGEVVILTGSPGVVRLSAKCIPFIAKSQGPFELSAIFEGYVKALPLAADHLISVELPMHAGLNKVYFHCSGPRIQMIVPGRPARMLTCGLFDFGLTVVPK